MAKRKAKEKTEDSAAVETAATVAGPANAEAAAAPAVAHPVEPDQVEQDNAAELLAMRRELDELNARYKTLESKFSSVRQQDLQIIDAERRATAAQMRMSELDNERKEEKKKYDAAIQSLRERTRELASGQLPLPFPEGEQAAEKPAEKKGKGGRKKKSETPITDAAKGQTAQYFEGIAPAAAADVEGEDGREPEERPLDVAPAKTGAAWDEIWDASLGMVSVSQPGGGMVSIQPGLLKILREHKFETVREVLDKIRSKTFQAKGIGATGTKQIESILEQWVRSGGDTEQPGAVPADLAAGEATGQVCGTCRSRRPVDATGPCECGESEFIYKTGYYGEVNCDEDGDFVASDSLQFHASQLPGHIAEVSIGFSEKQQKFFAGFSVSTKHPDGDTVDQEVVGRMPNCKDPAGYPQRTDALRAGFRMLLDATAPMLNTAKKKAEFENAGRIRFGVEPADPVQATA